MRSKASKEIPVGIGVDLEKWVGVENGIQRMMDRTILFNELKAKLNERDNFILMLLLQDISTPAGVAEALGVNYAAAAQAIHRVKNRIAASMAQSEKEEPESDRYCRVKG
jgi:DNA-directed RNA polymerase specialized sigma subunit